MPRRRFGRVGLAIDRLNPHPLHQSGDVEAPDLISLAGQKSLKHPAARERIIEMQFINPAHQRQSVGRDRPGQVIHAAPADPENLRLSAHRQVIVPVDHRFALGKSPAFPSAPDKKSRSSVSSPILACSVFTSIAGGLESGFVSAAKNPGSPFEKLRSPGRDLVRMDIELLGQFGQRLLALDSGQSHLRLEGRAVVPAWSLRHVFSCSRQPTPRSGRISTHPSCSDFPSQLSQSIEDGPRSPFMPGPGCMIMVR